MIDYHVHIGQYNDVYYDAREIFSAIENLTSLTKITEIHYSSTSSCRNDVDFNKIEEELAYSQSFTSHTLITKPYLWYVPQYINQGIRLSNVLNHFDYCGIKLHPFVSVWDLEEKSHKKCLEEIFEIASNKQNFSILLHCGNGIESRPSRFEYFFRTFPEANVILAHSTPSKEVINLLGKYKNLKSDTAFIQEDTLQSLLQSNVKNKIVFGSDFPITHYYRHTLYTNKDSLEEVYLENCNVHKYFNFS